MAVIALPNPVTLTLSVPVSQPWTDTGLDLPAGSSVGMTASGLASFAGGDPGHTPAGDPSCIAGEDMTAPGLPCFSLLGRLGNGVPFEVGKIKGFMVPADSRLGLGANDNGFSDNSGSWTATLSIRQPAGSATATPAATGAASAAPTSSPIPSVTGTAPAITPTSGTPLPTSTGFPATTTATSVPTPQSTSVISPTPPRPTATGTPQPTQTATAAPTGMATATGTPLPTQTATATAAPTQTATPTATTTPLPTQTATTTATPVNPSSGTAARSITVVGATSSYTFTAGVSGPATIGSCALTTTNQYALYVFDSQGTQVGQGVTPSYCNWVDTALNGGQTYTVSTVAISGTGSYRSAWSINDASVVWTTGGSIAKAGGSNYFGFPTLSARPLSLSTCGPAGADFDLYLISATGALLTGSASPSNCESLTYTPSTRGLFRLDEVAAQGSGPWSGTITTQ